MMYITDLLPSPDGKLLAVSLCSNKSNFVVVINFIDSHFSSELIGSSRALWACQSDEERFADIRIDHETYSGGGICAGWTMRHWNLTLLCPIIIRILWMTCVWFTIIARTSIV